MSPEQATGDQTVGARSDIYSLGCVLYEMLVGDPPYLGSTAQAVLGQIISGKPVTATEHRSAVPAHVDAAIRKALEKVPADRFTTAADFAAALGNTTFRHGEAPAAASVASAGPWKPTALAFAALSVVLVGVLANSGLGPPPSGPVERHPIEPPAPLERVMVRLSRDGSRIGYRIIRPDFPLFERLGPEDSQIWVRERGVLDLEAIPGTQGAAEFTFSPDGNSIAFIVGDTVKTVSLEGGRPLTVLVDEPAMTPDWGDDGYLYLGSSSSERPHVLRVPATGGEATPVPGTEDQGVFFEMPWVLPGSRGMLGRLYHDVYDEELTEIWAVDFETGSRHYLVHGIRAQYIASGHIVYLTGTGQLMAAGFDLESLQLTTDPIVLEEGLFGFLVSDRGDLIAGYGAPRRQDYQVMWVDRDGTMEVLDWTFRPGESNYDPTLSPDGSRVVLTSQQRDSSFLVKTWDLAGGTSQIVAQGRYRHTTWSADGRYVGMIEWADSSARFVRIRADGSGEIEPLTEVIPEPEDGDVWPGSWSPDDTLFVIGNRTGLAAIPAGTGVVDTLLVTGKQHGQATLSPDGRWLAYVEEDDDPAVAWRIFVRPFPNVNDEKIPVSAGQGYEPRWSRDGRTLYFVRFEGPGVQLLAASVRAGTGFSVPRVEPLFYPQTGSIYLGGGWSYDANADGSRFIGVRRLSTAPREDRLVLTTNFFAELRERVGGGS
jgi:serine/threonine-protein kinase